MNLDLNYFIEDLHSAILFSKVLGNGSVIQYSSLKSIISTFFKDHCDLTTLKENVAEALQKLIELDVVFARYTPFLVDERYKKLL